MCGRFYIEEEDNEEILRIVRRLDERFSRDNKIKTGEIYPTNTAAVLLNEQNKVEPKAMTWGFPGFKGSQVIINARSESASEKRMFSEALLSKRIAIPASGFFEWNRTGDKQKYFFKDPNEELLYMGGLYQVFPEGERFVILTTAANASMVAIHHRMPVLLNKGDIESFVFDYRDAKQLLLQTPKLLWKEKIVIKKEEAFEQLRLDLE